MNIGVMSKATSETVYTYIYHRFKTFAAFPSEHFHQYEITEGTDSRAYSFNGYQEEIDTEWVAPAINPLILADAEMTTVLEFLDEIFREFTKENIVLGITAMGKTGDVLSVMTERYIVEGNTRPISLMDTKTSGSITEMIKVIDYILSDIQSYNDLSPFITTQRMSEFKTKILTFLAGL